MEDFKMKLTPLLLSSLFALVACTTEKQIVEIEKPKVTIQESMNSDELTDAAEQLMGPYTFMLADSVLTKALERNPDNPKAQLYKATLRPLMATRGLWRRARPFAKANGNIGKWEQIMAKFPESPLKKFYTEGEEDIETPEDVMLLLDEVREAFNDLRKHIKANKDMNLVMNLNPHIFETFIKDRTFDACQVIETHTGNGTTYEFLCDYTNVALIRANSADLAVLQQMAAGEYLWLTMFTGYRVDGIEELAQIDPANKMTNQGKQTFLENKKNFGLKRASNAMASIRNLGSDFAVAARWALKFQENLCPEPVQNNDQPWWYPPSEIRRPGYLFEKGICITAVNASPSNLENLALLEALLTGPQDAKVPNRPGKIIKADPFKFFDNAVTDLRSILPESYNKCGIPTKLRDSSVGGMFPNADIEQHLTGKCNL